MIEQRWALLLLGWALAAGLQAILFLRQRRTRDATLVDAGWAFSLALLAVLYAVLAPGGIEHRVLIAVLVSIESLRIAWLVVGRIGDGEDTRYAELRERWRERGREQASFAVFFQAQAFLAAFLSLPFLLASFNESDGLEPLEWAGAALWVAAVAGETTADRQLAAFKRRDDSKGKTMREGLWRYSRHPNYFFRKTGRGRPIPMTRSRSRFLHCSPGTKIVCFGQTKCRPLRFKSLLRPPAVSCGAPFSSIRWRQPSTWRSTISDICKSIRSTFAGACMISSFATACLTIAKAG
jgi:steroid 5-alpha reductase family enzyme